VKIWKPIGLARSFALGAVPGLALALGLGLGVVLAPLPAAAQAPRVAFETDAQVATQLPLFRQGEQRLEVPAGNFEQVIGELFEDPAKRKLNVKAFEEGVQGIKQAQAL
jgi:hypothetical protein